MGACPSETRRGSGQAPKGGERQRMAFPIQYERKDTMNIGAVQTPQELYGLSAPAKSAKPQKAVEETSVQKDAYESGGKRTLVENEGYIYKPSMVDRMKAEQASIQSRFLDTVRDTLTKQGKRIGNNQDIWKVLASGDFTVDAKTKADAQEAISEDGYWGVKQTSERLLGFAKALVGGDPSRAEEMRAAFVKGFQAAGQEWGGDLPGIAHDTYDATMKLFDDWANEGKELSA